MKFIKFIICVVVIAGIYFGGMVLMREHKSSGNVPSIAVSNEVITCSVKDDEEVFLKGVTASDEEDGDLTSQVIVEGLSKFDENNERTINYVVFDSDDNIARATAKLKYKDYEAPRFTLNHSLSGEFSVDNLYLNNYVGATSMIDGDLSSKVYSESSRIDENNQLFYTMSVEDSCGQKESIELQWSFTKKDYSITIELTDYLIYVNKGEEIDFNEYISKVSFDDHVIGASINEVKDEIKINEDDYKPNKAGVYEVTYNVKYDGEYGFNKLVVIVMD